ncbi:hypothetical protein D3C81_2047160 [compost metagenome]
MCGRRHLCDWFINASKQPFGNRFLIDCTSKGFADPLIIEWRKVRVKLYIAHTLCKH